MSIRTTMVHKKGSNPGKFSYKHPGSRTVIETTVSKKSCSADNFVSKKGKRVEIFGGQDKVM